MAINDDFMLCQKCPGEIAEFILAIRLAVSSCAGATTPPRGSPHITIKALVQYVSKVPTSLPVYRTLAEMSELLKHTVKQIKSLMCIWSKSDRCILLQ